jgi:hypothetical protein
LFIYNGVERALGIPLEGVAVPRLVSEELIILCEGCLKATRLTESLAKDLRCLFFVVERAYHFF